MRIITQQAFGPASVLQPDVRKMRAASQRSSVAQFLALAVSISLRDCQVCERTTERKDVACGEILPVRETGVAAHARRWAGDPLARSG
jgi:hypothetical protein